jgi:hypothetical protein
VLLLVVVLLLEFGTLLPLTVPIRFLVLLLLSAVVVVQTLLAVLLQVVVLAEEVQSAHSLELHHQVRPKEIAVVMVSILDRQEAAVAVAVQVEQEPMHLVLLVVLVVLVLHHLTQVHQ